MDFERLTTSNLSPNGAADTLILKPNGIKSSPHQLHGRHWSFKSSPRQFHLSESSTGSVPPSYSVPLSPVANSPGERQSSLSWHWDEAGVRNPLASGQGRGTVEPAIGNNASLRAMAAHPAAQLPTQGIPAASNVSTPT